MYGGRNVSVVIAICVTLFFLFIAYYVNNRDIASPSVVILVIFVISQLLNLVYIEKWNVFFSVKYFYVIILGYVFSLCGDVCGKLVNHRAWSVKKAKSKKGNRNQKGTFRIPFLFNGIIIVFMLFVAYLYYNDMIRIARTYGDLSLQTVLQAVRNVTYFAGTGSDIEGGTSTLLSHAILASKAIAYIYIYILLYNIIYCKKKIRDNWILIIPPIIYLVESTFSTSRSQILYFMAGVCFILYLLWHCKNGKVSQKTKSKFIKYGLFTIIAFCIVFYLLGFLTRKSLAISFVDNIAVYVGGSQISLSRWLERFTETTRYFGEESLCGIRKVMLRLGLTDHYVVRHLEFENFGSYRGNVYTAFRRYISDFGILALPFMQFISTFIVSLIYNRIKKRKVPGGLIIVYGYIVYSICMEAIDELFFSSVFEISNAYIFVYGYIVFTTIKRNYLKNEYTIIENQCHFKHN